MAGINRYRQVGRTLTTSVIVTSTTAKTRETKISGDTSVHLGESDRLQEIEFAVSETQEYELPINAINKVLIITSAHRFRLMFRSSALDDYVLLSVCDKQFILNGNFIGQLKLVGDYTEPTACKIVFA